MLSWLGGFVLLLLCTMGVMAVNRAVHVIVQAQFEHEAGHTSLRYSADAPPKSYSVPHW